MKYLRIFLLLFAFLPLSYSYGQGSKFDSLLKVGKVGYHVFCKSKSANESELRVKPIGFQNTAREADFYIKGRITSALIDDLNNDGFPDLVLVAYTDSGDSYKTIYAFASDQNKSIVPIAMPDLMLDGKLNGGYRGQDEFTMMEGTIMRKFPVYKPGDEKDKPTGGKRAIQYTMTGKAESGYKFKVMQTYELK